MEYRSAGALYPPRYYNLSLGQRPTASTPWLLCGFSWRYFTQLVNRVDYRHAITNRHIRQMLKPINIAVAVLFVAVIGLGYMVMSQDSNRQESLESRPVKSPTQAPTSKPATAPTEAPAYRNKPRFSTPTPTPCRETGIFNPRGTLKGKCETNEEFWERENTLEQEGRTCRRNGGEWNRLDGICTWK